jgi:hypothetical protein
MYQDLQDLLHAPDLVPCEFFHFPKFKVVENRRRFNDITMIQGTSWDGLGKLQHT